MAVQTLTYGDKQFLNQNADIPATNKVQDTDMNEIKSVVNNNATEASNNTTNISNITGKILWANPSPSSAISSATTITLSSSDYDMLEVFYLQTTSSSGGTLYSSRFLKGYSTRMRIDTSDSANVYRTLTYNSDTSYTITTAYSSDALASLSSLAIPLYIVGYKTGLFN